MMKRKTAFITLFIVFLLSLLSVPATLGSIVFFAPGQYDNTFFGEMDEKVKRLDETKGNRIIFVGGSSLPFGLRSSYVEKEIPSYQAVNFGLYASLGSKVMMDMSLDAIREGDIVILSPEQHSQTLSLYFNPMDMWRCIDGHTSLLSRIERGDRERMFGVLPSFASEKFSYLSKGEVLNPEGIYNRSSFDDYGEISSSLCKRNIMKEKYDINTPISFDESVISTDFISYMNQYHEEIKKRKASLYYHFCPMNKAAIVEENQIDTYYEYLQKKISFPILGNPHDMVLDPIWFYDTNFHLNKYGALKYTKQMIKDIKLEIELLTKTNMDDPSKPEESTSSELFVGNDEDADCFLYQENEKGMEIISLSEEGKNKTSLTIPTTYQGKQVYSFRSETFQNNEIIQQIHIQKNIYMLLDYAFENTPSLEKIILDHEKPSQIRVGMHLLDGCNGNIYVPKASISNYKLDYSWSIYKDRVFPLP